MTLKMSTAYHPESYGQTEIVNKTIDHYLHATVHDIPQRWVELLSWVELWYNMSFHHSLGMTVFQALYGRSPSKLIDYHVGDSNVEAIDVLLQQGDWLLHELCINLQVAQDWMKKYGDLKHRPFEFEVSNWVWLCLQPF